MNFCPKCGKSLETVKEAAFCPYCGGAVAPQAPQADSEPQEVRDLLGKLEGMADLKKKHQHLLEAQEKYPQSLAIAQELLFMGRLYERGGKNVDFSVIKSYLLMLYLRPEELSEKRQDELREELLFHPLLEKCLDLSSDRDAFMRRYLLRLSGEFIELFLRGDSRYMHRIFGFGLDSQAPKYLAAPLRDMLLAMRQDDKLSPQQRELLMQTLYQAFGNALRDTHWLDERLHEAGLSMAGAR